MSKIVLLSFLIAILSMAGCSQKPEMAQPNVDFNSIEKDFRTWWNYHYKNINLSSDFVAIDNVSKKIRKEDFLKILTSGDFIPLRLISKDSITYYKLFKLDPIADNGIRSAIKNNAASYYKNYKMEGTDFPVFDFKDLNGVVYNNENLKGKIVLIKCWYIGCTACVAEFPKLNDLVETYQDRNDIVFISLAFDSEEKLKKFLSQKITKYAVVANQETFLRKELGIEKYPTHIILDRDGKILKVINRADELLFALKFHSI
jgi:peroxiredoxin